MNKFGRTETHRTLFFLIKTFFVKNFVAVFSFGRWRQELAVVWRDIAFVNRRFRVPFPERLERLDDLRSFL